MHVLVKGNAAALPRRSVMYQFSPSTSVISSFCAQGVINHSPTRSLVVPRSGRDQSRPYEIVRRSALRAWSITPLRDRSSFCAQGV